VSVSVSVSVSIVSRTANPRRCYLVCNFGCDYSTTPLRSPYGPTTMVTMKSVAGFLRPPPMPPDKTTSITTTSNKRIEINSSSIKRETKSNQIDHAIIGISPSLIPKNANAATYSSTINSVAQPIGILPSTITATHDSTRGSVEQFDGHTKYFTSVYNSTRSAVHQIRGREDTTRINNDEDNNDRSRTTTSDETINEVFEILTQQNREEREREGREREERETERKNQNREREERAREREERAIERELVLALWRLSEYSEQEERAKERKQAFAKWRLSEDSEVLAYAAATEFVTNNNTDNSDASRWNDHSMDSKPDGIYKSREEQEREEQRREEREREEREREEREREEREREEREREEREREEREREEREREQEKERQEHEQQRNREREEREEQAVERERILAKWRRSEDCEQEERAIERVFAKWRLSEDSGQEEQRNNNEDEDKAGVNNNCIYNNNHSKVDVNEKAEEAHDNQLHDDDNHTEWDLVVQYNKIMKKINDDNKNNASAFDALEWNDTNKSDDDNITKNNEVNNTSITDPRETKAIADTDSKEVNHDNSADSFQANDAHSNDAAEQDLDKKIKKIQDDHEERMRKYNDNSIALLKDFVFRESREAERALERAAELADREGDREEREKEQEKERERERDEDITQLGQFQVNLRLADEQFEQNNKTENNIEKCEHHDAKEPKARTLWELMAAIHHWTMENFYHAPLMATHQTATRSLAIRMNGADTSNYRMFPCPGKSEEQQHDAKQTQIQKWLIDPGSGIDPYSDTRKINQPHNNDPTSDPAAAGQTAQCSRHAGTNKIQKWLIDPGSGTAINRK
jgi:hypothetical protein